LTRLISAETLYDYLDTGCIPPTDVNIIKNAAPRHPASFTTAGRLDADKVRRWRDAGYTVQMRNLQRWHPPMAVMLKALQHETGCTGYASAFVTPAGEQGLEWHWDQYLGIVVQLAGTKRWEMWEPVVDSPTRDYQSSVQRWNPAWLPNWQANGPDLSYDLTPGQVLILPRGWVHNPHSRESTEASVHLTVVLHERTPLWIAEHLTSSAIHDPAFRAALPPADITTDGLTAHVSRTRRALIDHLQRLDVDAVSSELRQTATTEAESA
jgi:ribosomal protein L16 Arg81 hydroxylase